MNLLSLEGQERVLDGEVHGEPRVHARSVLRRICAIEYILIELGCEIPTEAMYFSLLLGNSEDNFVELLHASILTLAVLLDFFHYRIIIWLRVRNVSKSKDLLGLVSAWKGGREDSHDIRELERIQLLRDWDSCLQAL